MAKKTTSSSTKEKTLNSLKDYSQSKDAYDGNLNSGESTDPSPDKRPRRDGPGGE